MAGANMVGDLNTYFNIFIACNTYATLPGYAEYFIELVKRYIKDAEKGRHVV